MAPINLPALQKSIVNLEKITQTLTQKKSASTQKKAATAKSTSTKTTAKKATTTQPKESTLSALTKKVKAGVASGDSIINQFKDKIPEDQMNLIKLQQALEQRSQAVNMVTNLLKTMHEMAMSVVRNFRVNA